MGEGVAKPHRKTDWGMGVAKPHRKTDWGMGVAEPHRRKQWGSGVAKPHRRTDCSLVPRYLTRRNGLVNQVKFLGLAHAFCDM